MMRLPVFFLIFTFHLSAIDIVLPSDNQSECGIFPSVLTSYEQIITQKNNVFDACEISVADANLIEETSGNNNFSCSTTDGPACSCDPAVQNCSEDNSCTIVPEPDTRLEYSVIDTNITDSYTVNKDWNNNDNGATTVSGNDTSLSLRFFNEMYGNYTFTQDVSSIYFDPQNTYNNSDTPVMVLGDIRFDGNSQTVTFEGGDYYFQSFKIDKDTNGNINQINLCVKDNIRIFVENDFVYSGNHLNDAGCGGKIFIYVRGDTEVDANGGGSGTMPMFLYTEGDVSIENSGDSNEWFGAITAEGKIDISGENINFRYDPDGYPGYGDCEEYPSYYPTGLFDAWDTFRNIEDRNISTKIVNQDFTLTIASLSNDNNATEAKSGIDVKYNLMDTNSSVLIANWYDFNASDVDQITSETFHISAAYQNVRVVFSVCSDYNATSDTYRIFPHDDCDATCPGTDIPEADYDGTADPCWRYFLSSDNFAIRPYAFRVFGKNQYKRAGEDFNVTIIAVDEEAYTVDSGKINDPSVANAVSGVLDYNATLSNLDIQSAFYTPTDDEIAQMQEHTGKSEVAECPFSGVFTINNPSDRFRNGEINASLSFSETGILELHVSEKSGSEWALVDRDDTNDSQRLIREATQIEDQFDISQDTLMLFVPYRFDTAGEYNSTNAKTWVYMHDINASHTTFQSPRMAAFIDYTITAKNKDGQITQNYTKTCFPDVSTDAPTVNNLKLNTTFDLFLDAWVLSTSDANITLYTEDNNSNAIYTPNKHKPITEGNNTIQEWISPFEFTNGMGEARVYFNIDREINIVQNPAVITLQDINTSISWGTDPGAPSAFNGTSIATPLSFFYARANSEKFFYDDITDPSVVTPVSVEIYCDLGLGGCASRGLNLLDAQTSETAWWRAVDHDNVTGNDGNIQLKVGTTTPGASASLNNTNVSIITNGTDNTITVNADSNVRPMTVEIDLDTDVTTAGYTDRWLIYNRYNNAVPSPFYKVRFINDNTNGGWTGYGGTGHVVGDDINAKKSRRLEW